MILKNFKFKELAGIEYHGCEGISKSCLNAIIRLIQFGDRIEHASLLTLPEQHSSIHCFLLSVNDGDFIAIKSGFTSGYNGEGPAKFSLALQLLERHGVEIEEFIVPKKFITKLNKSALTRRDIEEIREMRPVLPSQIYDYLYNEPEDAYEKNQKINSRFPKVIPFYILDPRITDLAIEFNKNPDTAILSAYRRLEDIVRDKSGIIDKSNSQLFSKAFDTETGPLSWDINDLAEKKGRISLFTGVYMAYRNRRSHQEPSQYDEEAVTEFLLVNQLYLIESETRKTNKSD